MELALLLLLPSAGLAKYRGKIKDILSRRDSRKTAKNRTEHKVPYFRLFRLIQSPRLSYRRLLKATQLIWSSAERHSARYSAFNVKWSTLAIESADRPIHWIPNLTKPMVCLVMVMKMKTQVRKVVFKESWDWRDFTDNSNEISISHHLQRVLT